MPDVLSERLLGQCPDGSSSDEDMLVTAAANGDADALETLVNRYKGYIKTCSGSYFLIGADRDDVIQEGMIGLYKAVLSFKPERGVRFKTFAELCIKRQMISAVKTALCKKHMPLNTYISLNHGDEMAYAEADMCFGRVGDANPEQLMIDKETVLGMRNEINRVLSPFELRVFLLYIGGMPYGQIAAEVGREPKAVDNALQRIKRKLEKLLCP